MLLPGPNPELPSGLGLAGFPVRGPGEGLNSSICMPGVSAGSHTNMSSMCTGACLLGELWERGPALLPSSKEKAQLLCSSSPRVSGVLRGQAGRKGLLTKHVSDSLGRGGRRVLIAWSPPHARKSPGFEAALSLRVGGRG